MSDKTMTAEEIVAQIGEIGDLLVILLNNTDGDVHKRLFGILESLNDVLLDVCARDLAAMCEGK